MEVYWLRLLASIRLASGYLPSMWEAAWLSFATIGTLKRSVT